jgi:hypothetical protein
LLWQLKEVGDRRLPKIPIVTAKTLSIGAGQIPLIVAA